MVNFSVQEYSINNLLDNILLIYMYENSSLRICVAHGNSAECDCHRSTFGCLTPNLWSVVKSFKGEKSTLYLHEAEK